MQVVLDNWGIAGAPNHSATRESNVLKMASPDRSEGHATVSALAKIWHEPDRIWPGFASTLYLESKLHERLTLLSATFVATTTFIPKQPAVLAEQRLPCPIRRRNDRRDVHAEIPLGIEVSARVAGEVLQLCAPSHR